MKSGFPAMAYAAFFVLGVLLLIEWLPSSDAAIKLPPVIHAAHGTAPETETAARDTASWADAIVRRPLFSASRRPARSGGHTAVASASGLPRLSGIMITGAGKRAIFSPDGGKALTLAEGAMVDEYTIRHIAADRVVLRGAKGDMILHPSYDASRTGGTTVNQPLFPQPFGQNGANPGLPQPGLNPGFTPPQVPPLGFPQPQPQPNAANASDDDDNDNQPGTPPPAPVFPGIRGPFIPRGRN